MHRRTLALSLVCTAVVLTQCATPSQQPPQPAGAVSPPPAAADVHAVTAAELGASWHPGCPVGPELLRRVGITYLGYDGKTHRGELIVHRDLSADVIAAFDRLYRLTYPIEKIQLPQRYPGAQDELSMQDNNTSAFNCRDIPGSPHWSQHAYGRAVDINPLVNPSISSTGRLEPTTAGAYLDRSRHDPGLLRDGDPAVRAFTDDGWTWGGHWRNPKDYQHFERPA